MAPKIITRKEIYEGQLLPKWYGVAYWDFDSERVICYPIPLNFVVAWIRSAFFWMKKARRKSWWERELSGERSRAYYAGYTKGKVDGYMELMKDIKEGKSG